MFKNRSRPLNLLDPMVQEISKKYNLAPKIVAYLRAALVDGHYTRQTLITHIEFENGRRKLAIEKHKISTTLSEDDKKKIIRYTEINIEFRENIVVLLRECNYGLLADLLKQKSYERKRF